MSTIVTRSGKGSPLTHTEVDNNFTNLNTDKLQSGDTAASLVITSADINGGTIDGTTIGASTASTGAFTTLSASSTATLNTLSSSGATITGGSINGTTVGATTASTGAFTTLSATGVTTVSAGSVSAPAITTTGDTNTGIFFPAADTIAFTEGGTEAMRIDSSGNVGIGTTSPSTLLQLGGATNKSMRIDSATNNAGYFGVFNALTILSANRNPSTGAFTDTGKAAAAIILTADTSDGNIVFNTTASNNTSPTERMRIDSSGTLFIGKTSTANDITTAGFFFRPFGKMVATTADSGEQNFVSAHTSATGTVTAMQFFYNSTSVGTIQKTSTATSYNTSSDYRLKENIAPMTGALAIVSALKPVTYTWKSTGEDGQGFIAHELGEVVPDAVTGEKDAVDAEGNPKYQGIDTSFLVATLTAAIQEQQAIITDLKSRIEALESK
jgi:hypothetical protein